MREIYDKTSDGYHGPVYTEAKQVKDAFGRILDMGAEGLQPEDIDAMYKEIERKAQHDLGLPADEIYKLYQEVESEQLDFSEVERQAYEDMFTSAWVKRAD